MKINTKVRYGLKALAYIAENSSDKKLVRIKEISEDQDISIQYLEQILFKLKNENIIEGKRGPTGGYKLTLKPSQINLYTIFLWRYLMKNSKKVFGLFAFLLVCGNVNAGSVGIPEEYPGIRYDYNNVNVSLPAFNFTENLTDGGNYIRVEILH